MNYLKILAKIEEAEVVGVHLKFYFAISTFFWFSQNCLGETQIEVIWMKKIGMKISNREKLMWKSCTLFYVEEEEVGSRDIISYIITW